MLAHIVEHASRLARWPGVHGAMVLVWNSAKSATVALCRMIGADVPEVSGSAESCREWGPDRRSARHPAVQVERSCVWVTGASSGIGRALALRLARNGAPVAATARRAPLLSSLEEDAAAAGGLVRSFPADVTSRDDVAATVARIERDLGPIGAAVFCAGVTGPRSRPGALDPEAVRKTFAVNVFGVVEAVAAVAPRMAARGQGRIIVVGSIAGYFGLPGSASYSASKAALIALAESWRTDFERQGIVLQIANPGFVRTEMTARKKYRLPFVLEPEQAAAAIHAGLSSRHFEIAFPHCIALTAKAVRLLPYSPFFALLRALRNWRQSGRGVPTQSTPEGEDRGGDGGEAKLAASMSYRAATRRKSLRRQKAASIR